MVLCFYRKEFIEIFSYSFLNGILEFYFLQIHRGSNGEIPDGSA